MILQVLYCIPHSYTTFAEFLASRLTEVSRIFFTCLLQVRTLSPVLVGHCFLIKDDTPSTMDIAIADNHGTDPQSTISHRYGHGVSNPWGYP